MKKLRLINAFGICVFILMTTSTNAAFVGRLPSTPGGIDYQAYYDDQLNITWLAEADAFSTPAPDSGGPGLVEPDLILVLANAWVTNLTINGVSGWRLPNMDVNGDVAIVDCTSSTQADCKDNEYGHLFYYGASTTLGSGITSTSPDPFTNVQSSFYWSNDPAAVFDFTGTSGSSAGDDYYVWAIHDGDIGTVPVPAAVWLFGSGLLGLIGIARKKAA